MRSLAAPDAETKFAELIERAEKGESFEITKAGRPVARLVPVPEPDRARARTAAEQLRHWLAEGPSASEDEAQANWERLKDGLEAEDDERLDEWLSSSTPR
jgi:prevent-host-death family protein